MTRQKTSRQVRRLAMQERALERDAGGSEDAAAVQANEAAAFAPTKVGRVLT